MKIYQKGTHRVATKFPYRDGSGPKYRVFPASREREPGGTRHLNTLQQEIAFDEIEHAAEFLVRHRGSAIRMSPGNPIISRNVVIDFDEAEPAVSTDTNEPRAGENQ